MKRPIGPSIADLTSLFRRTANDQTAPKDAISDVVENDHHQENAPPAKNTSRRTSVVSLRLTAEERRLLEAQAGGQPLSTSIRSRLLGQEAAPRARTRKIRRTPCDEVAVARALRGLGEARMLKELETLHWALDVGNLSLSESSEAALRDACADIKALRDDLMRALGLRVTS